MILPSEILSVIVFLPVVGAIFIALVTPKDDAKAARTAALLFTGVTFVLSLVLFFGFDLKNSGIQFVNKIPWIPQLGVSYFLGVDGLSLPLVILTTFLSFLAIFVSWHITLRPKEYFALLLVLETGVLGVFTSLDLLLFFLFWEVELAPMYLLIAVWGSGRREYSAMKFLIYTILGSAVMLVGILVVYFQAGLGSFDITLLSQVSFAKEFQIVMFFVLFFGFAVKLPVWPFHTWLPDAHVDAPTAVSVLLAGVLLKMGGYAMIRIVIGILPDAAAYFAPVLAAMAVVNVLWGAGACMVQKDLKKMVAYSSVSHMGYVLLGLSAMNQIGFTGAALQMFTHGTITGLMFACVGVVYEKAHTRQIPELGGLAHRMPWLTVLFVMAGLASLGLPAMSGFVAELTVFIGGWEKQPLATGLGAAGIVVTAGYILWMLERAFFGPLNPRWAHLKDASLIEAAPLVALVFVIILVGVYPTLITNVIDLAIPGILSRIPA